MRFTLCIALLVTASVTWGQNIGQHNYGTPQIPAFEEHPAHAEWHDMRPETSLLSGPVTVAQGERPLWECGKLASPVSLGEFARHYRLIHKSAEKSAIFYTNQ